ncbi:hypothetical protein FGB62_21g33 [Gracilaria domingensis]|nr:hypothetical protein FGB62_21g33 [Gracilaria domingensis]
MANRARPQHTFVICPTRQYLSRFCTAIARLRRYERQIVFVCSSNASRLAKEYLVHYSRIIYHGGPLLHHVRPFVENTSNYVVRVPIEDNCIAFKYVTDYVYAASVNLSRLSVSDCVQLALSCSKWRCVDFYVAVLRFLVQRNRLLTPRQFAISTPLLWLPKERIVFADYYFLNVEFVMKRMHLTHLIDLAFASHAANRINLSNRVLTHIMESNPNMTSTQLLRFLPLFQHFQVPGFMRSYLVRIIGRSIHSLNPAPHRNRSVLATVLDPCSPSVPKHMEDTLYSKHLAAVDNEEMYWNLVCRNGLADSVIRFLMRSERGSLVQIVHTLARYIEPRRETIETLADMLSDISAMMTTRESDMLLRDMMNVENWSKRATMLVASVFLYETKESYETQLPVKLHWAHVGAQPIMELASASVDGIKFCVQVHSTVDHESTVVLTCRCSESSSLMHYTAIRFVVWIVDTDCRCDCLHLFRRFSDGNFFAFDERGLMNWAEMLRLTQSVTLLNVIEVNNWRLKHGKDCTAQMKIRIELQRRQA